MKLLMQVFNNQDAVAALIFCLSAGCGQVLHAVKKWAEGSVGSPFSWLIGNFRRTVAAMIGNITGMVVFIQSGVLGPILSQPNGWWAIFLFGLMNGMSADSAINKSGAAGSVAQGGGAGVGQPQAT